MLQVPTWVVVLVMVAHAMIAVFNERITEVTSEAWVGIAVSASLVGLNILQSVMKPITEAVRAVGRAFQGMPEGKPAKTARKRRK